MSAIIYGCTEPSACNYDLNATDNDGSCEYSFGDLNQDGILDILDIVSLVNIIMDFVGY